MFLFHTSLFNVVASPSARTDLVMILQLLLVSGTCGMLVPIQSKKRSVFFDQWYHLKSSWTALHQFHVRCNSIGETCRCFYNKVLFHDHFICWGVLLEIFASLQGKESKYRWQPTVLMSWIACKWSFQFSSLSADIKFFSMFTNFNNVDRCRSIPDAAADLSLNSL